MNLPIWKKLSEEIIKQNDYWTYKLDQFEIDGSEGEYHYVHTLGSTLVIPITSDNKIVMVRQFRYLNQKESLEFPCGSVQKNITPEENAQKELREESGYAAKNLIHIGAFSPYTGASDEICEVYIGTSLYLSPLPNDSTEHMIVEEYSIEEIDKMMADNLIWDGLTLSAWLIARNKIVDKIT